MEGKFDGWLSLFLLVLQFFDVKSLDQLTEKHIQQKKLKSIGFHEFELSAVNHQSIGSARKRLASVKNIENADGMRELHFNAFGEDVYMHVQRTKSVLHPDAMVSVTNGASEKPWKGQHPDCFLTGTSPSHDGSVTLSYCDTLQGHMITSNHEYHIEEIPHHSEKGVTMLISRKPRPQQKESIPISLYANDNIKVFPRHRRSVPSRNFTIELAVYTDSEFTKLFSTRNIWKRLELMIAKYNGVQMEWGRYDALGYNVTISIKRMTFFEHNPSWYHMSPVIGESLSSFCYGTKDEFPYDLMFMHTGMNTDVIGRAYQGSICKYRFRCGINNAATFTQYTATAHEIGHTLGMNHDNLRNCTSPNIGNMGGYGAGWSTCSRNDMNSFLQQGHGRCLWQTNIQPTMIRMPHVKLIPISMGQKYSPDEICELKYGTNWRYREYPLIGSCQFHSCVNHNPGIRYGDMRRQDYTIAGAYCGDGKICLKTGCVTWQYARQSSLEVRAGGWSSWGGWQSCSRPCGTGMLWRRRKCNNPSPKNHAPCDEDEYEASKCNTGRCPTDSDNTDKLIKQRASETCSTFIRFNVINTTLYLPKGDKYSYHKDGQCEVKCDDAPGHTAPAFTRFGLMPHGTPCSSNLHKWDIEKWPRRSGFTANCLDGKCMKFGCDEKLKGASYDECGICGGDSSTCHVVNGVYRQHLQTGERDTIVKIPVGAYNIQFWFEYGKMKQNFLEIWTKDDAVVMASRLTKSWVYITGDNPISFAGSLWHFHFYDQHLYTKGPLRAPAVVKLFKYKNSTNVGVNYAYSLPLPVKLCHGSCQNGGTYQRSICSCMCPKGYYGNKCESRCNTYCMNGAPVNQSTCTCSCNDHQTGEMCACKANTTGPNCSSCKPIKCSQNKVLDPRTCTCECPSGFTGPTCKSASRPSVSVYRRNMCNLARSLLGFRPSLIRMTWHSRSFWNIVHARFCA